ncbi:MAG: enoyl-CoA hydratase/isomerase family protein [Dehalococcoidia bacterium]|nr:MAG: enoyl-CoA hydratase/isomerase family protein [Dehalococcoidia bacterium]
MTSFETIIYEKRDGIAYVTLNRPEVLNRYNIQMRDELYQVLTAIRDDPDVLVAIFKGEGERAFCVGADLTEFGTAPSPIIARQVRWERDIWGLFSSLKQPLIAAVHGYVLGSGVEIALFCDIRIASEEAIFGLPEVSLGMIPAAGGTQTLPRVIGKGRALQILLTGDRIDAQEAFRIGLVNMVVSRGELYLTADRMAQKILSRSPIAVRYAKEATMRGLDLTLEEGLVMERKLAKILKALARKEVPALCNR